MKLSTNALASAIGMAVACSMTSLSVSGCEKPPPKSEPTASQRSERIAPTSSKPETPSDFGSFWGQFRTAVIGGDNDAIDRLTQFPFRTRGQLDDSAWVSYDRRGFRDLLPTLLDQDSGQRPEHDPMRALIRRTTTVEHLDPDEAEIYLGSFVFGRVGGRWLFTHAFVDAQ